MSLEPMTTRGIAWIDHDPRSGRVAVPDFGETATRTYGYALGRPYRWPEHHHVEHELLWAATGRVEVVASGRHWSLAATTAIWLPSGVEHAVDATADADVRCVFFQPDCCRTPWASATPVVADELVRALIGTLSEQGRAADTGAIDSYERLEQVLVDRLRPAPPGGAGVPLPADPRARDVAIRLLDDVADNRTLADWGRAVGAAERTLARLFVAETGMTFGQWRTAVRVRRAVELLTAGRSVTACAGAVGYRNISGFIEAFRSIVGETPGRFMQSTRWAQ